MILVLRSDAEGEVLIGVIEKIEDMDVRVCLDIEDRILSKATREELHAYQRDHDALHRAVFKKYRDDITEYKAVVVY